MFVNENLFLCLQPSLASWKGSYLSYLLLLFSHLNSNMDTEEQWWTRSHTLTHTWSSTQGFFFFQFNPAGGQIQTCSDIKMQTVDVDFRIGFWAGQVCSNARNFLINYIKSIKVDALFVSPAVTFPLKGRRVTELFNYWTVYFLILNWQNIISCISYPFNRLLCRASLHSSSMQCLTLKRQIYDYLCSWKSIWWFCVLVALWLSHYAGADRSSYMFPLVVLSGPACLPACLPVHWLQNCFYKGRNHCSIALQPNRLTRLFSYSM